MAAHTLEVRGRPIPTRRMLSPPTLALMMAGGLAPGTAGLLGPSVPRAAVSAVRTDTATPNSGPIAISPDDRFVWMVDPDADMVNILNGSAVRDSGAKRHDDDQ